MDFVQVPNEPGKFLYRELGVEFEFEIETDNIGVAAVRIYLPREIGVAAQSPELLRGPWADKGAAEEAAKARAKDIIDRKI